jgi:hypothetical protein
VSTDPDRSAHPGPGDAAGGSPDDRGRRLREELEAALTAAAEHARVTGRLQRARAAEAQARERAVQARERLADETADVEALESFSPTRIWAALRGSRDADLDRERAEQQAAEYAVARADALMLSAHDEVRRAEAELRALGDVERRRRDAMAAMEEWLQSSGSPAGAELTRLSERAAATHAERIEVREALEAGAAAAQSLAAAQQVLGSADGWATYDPFFGGGMLTDMVKYDRMDEAQRLLHLADQSVRRLSRELADVGMQPVVAGLQVDGFTRAFDVWFDNIFTDWSVKSRIGDAARQTAAAAGTVAEVRRRLAARDQELTAELSRIAAERERVVRG